MITRSRHIWFVASLLSALVVSSAPAEQEPRTWARAVPERMDDFAWENDLVAFRAYGPAIKSGKEDSGIDCWLKRVPYPIIDKWYSEDKKGKSYHQDHGEGYDPYHVGSSRGCGGVAIWKDGRPVLSDVYRTAKIVSLEREKTVFELTYRYELADGPVDEVKRITIELGSRLFRSESTFTKEGKPANLEIAIGITTHDGKAEPFFSEDEGWMFCWETIDGAGLGTGVAIDPDRVLSMKVVKSGRPDESHIFAMVRTDDEGKVVHNAGYGWERAGAIKTAEDWEGYLRGFLVGNDKRKK